MLRRNVGSIDRLLRLTLGGILFLGGLILLSGKTTLGVALTVVGLLVLLTGIIRFCALYIPFGISTVRPETRISSVCDCAAWMKARQDNCAAIAPPPRGEEEAAGVVPTARGR